MSKKPRMKILIISTLICITLMFSLLSCGGGGDNGSGDNGSGNNLPSCTSSELFTHSPIDLNALTAISPLGTLNPSSHTFPTRHTGCYTTDPQTPPQPQDREDVFSPGDITIISIDQTTYGPTTRSYTSDYSIRFAVCKEVEGYFNHIMDLDSSLLNQVSSQLNNNCQTYSTADETATNCSVSTDIPVKAGTRLGTVSYLGTLDYGLDDSRTNLFFVNPSRHSHYLTTACPLDYYEPAMKSTLEAKLGRYDGSVIRTTAPVCGKVDFDVAGTAQGVWVTNTMPAGGFVEAYGIALAYDNITPSEGGISIGNVGSSLDGQVLNFTPVTSGTLNRRFDQVTADGQVYCYDASSDSVFIEVISGTSLKFEARTGQGCGAGPWTFSANVIDFIR